MTDPRGMPDPARPWQRRAVACIAVLALTLAASACQSSPPEEPSAGQSPGPSAGPSADSGAPVERQAVDACTLLTEAEVTPLIGANDGGRSGGASTEGSACTWENPDTYHSITVDIGAAGTAASGRLPAESAYGQTEPGPDGIRFAPGNIAEFVVADRACEIQVVTSVTSNADRSAAVRLIGLIRDRI